jgi:hypothetical protein
MWIMKNANKRFYLGVNKILAYLIGATGVFAVSCESEEVGPMVNDNDSNDTTDLFFTEYGMPMSEYKVRGQVTDKSTGSPIEGIKVSNSVISDTTDADGNYSILLSGISTDSMQFDLKFQDIKPDDVNYKSKDTVVLFQNSLETEFNVPLSKESNLDTLIALYGMPTATYKIKGVVKDSCSNIPYNNVEVSYGCFKDTTDANGEYEININDTYSPSKEYELNFHGIDYYNENIQFSKKVTIFDSNIIGGSGFFVGIVEKIFDVFYGCTQIMPLYGMPSQTFNKKLLNSSK